MAIKEPVPLDLKTVNDLKEVLDDAWYSLSAEQQATMSKTTLAERILVSAAKGERDRERLLAVALEAA
jgi:heat shock protein HspQ